MAGTSIDLNADLGEGYGPWPLTDDAGLMSVISSANMACGFHAGDANHMASVCALAVEHGVSLGAHPGYDDKPYFGRRPLSLPLADITRMVAYQIGAAQAMAALAGTRIRYVKVHGALSNQSAENPALAAALADAIAGVDRELVWLVISGSAHIDAAEKQSLSYRQEAFIDRAYAANGQLAPRSQAGSVHTDVDVMLRQVEQIVTAGTVTTIDGETLPLAADSLCLHGDGVHALETAQRVRAHIEQLGVAVAPFC
ncbi:MAG: 5-oxoprolinase subunit PxpA [Pseudomonadota bacterium]